MQNNVMFGGTGVGLHSNLLTKMNGKGKFFEGEHEYSPVFSKEGNPIPHKGLPIIKTPIDNKFRDSFLFVVDPATMVAIDVEDYEKGIFSLVPANGGTDRTVTYTEKDAEYGVLTADNKIVAEGATKVFKANVPAGWVFYYGRQNPMTHQGHVLDEFQIGSQIDTEGFLILPHVYKGENNKYDFKIGDLIAGDNPTADDKLINPKAKWGGWRVWYEAEKDTLGEGVIERPNGAAGVVYGKRKDSLRQATAKVISVVDITDVPRDSSRLAEDYGDTTGNIVGPGTNGYLPTYWDFWKLDFAETGNSIDSLNKYSRKDEFECKLIFALIGKR